MFDNSIVLNNGVKIPQLGLGTWFIDDDKAADAVKAAVEIGYRHIDTAQAYGNERGVGEGVRTCGIPREKLFVAQYERGQRTPKQETLIRIAEILEVDVRNFLSPGIATMDELMETLFWMDEENRGLFHLFLLNDSESETVGITMRDKKTMSYLQEWMGKKQKLGDGRITEEEYLEWKLHWPEDKRKTEYKTV